MMHFDIKSYIFLPPKLDPSNFNPNSYFLPSSWIRLILIPTH